MATTNAGHSWLLELIADNIPFFLIASRRDPPPPFDVSDGGIGSNLDDPSLFQKALTRDDIVVDHDARTITVTCVMDETEGNGYTYTEIALDIRNAQGIRQMMVREIISNPELKNSAKRFQHVFVLDYSGA